jgi:hypothetical protein
MRLKPQSTRAPYLTAGVIGVLYSIHNRHFGEIEWAHAIEARDIDAILLRIGAPLMVRVDATARAKEMLCLASIEAVTGQHVLASNKAYAADCGRNRNRAAHPTIRTGASTDGVKAVAEFGIESHSAAVTLTTAFVRVLCHHTPMSPQDGTPCINSRIAQLLFNAQQLIVFRQPV